MTEKELQTIIGLFQGMQISVVHLANVLAHKTGISPDDLATSFEETAEAIPAESENRHLMQISLRQVAAGIRNSSAGPEWSDLISKLLH